MKKQSTILLLSKTGVWGKAIVILFLLSNLIFPASAQQYADKKLLLKVVHYDIDLRIDYTNRKLYSKCELTVRNTSSTRTQIIPLLLYRLMKVSSIKDEKGNPMSFSQRVLSFEDLERYQANYIEISPARPLLKGDTKKLIIEYEGYLFGFTETGMGYVSDKIDPGFTILRPDCLAFPELGYPSDKVNRLAGVAPSFNYTIKVNVPDSLVVVNGGELINRRSKNGNTIYTYRNTKLAWRIDIAIGKYKIIETPMLKIYYLEQDSAGAETVFKYAKRTIDLYTGWWGPLQGNNVFSVIEIPSGYGSQADETCILQSADVFLDSTEMRQLYHELSHLWNINSKDKYYPRWSEGLATFIEYLSIEKLENRPYLDYVTEWYLNLVKKEIAADSLLKTTPFNEFGKKGIQSYAYEIGMLMFRVLYEVMGEDDFNKCLAKYYTDYYLTGATTDQFVETSVRIGGKNLVAFFKDWMYTPRYTQLISEGLTIKEISKRYIQ